MYSTDIQFARTLRFLRATSSRKIANKLAIRGFDIDDAREGWELFNAACGKHISISNHYIPNREDKEIFKSLNEWEDKWFTITGIVLESEFPQIHESIFQGIERLDGDKVVGTISVFLERIDTLKQNTDGQSQAAMSALRKVGLTDDVIDEAREPLEKLRSGELLGAGPLPEPNFKKEKEAMWGWFVKWSKLARTLDFSRRERVMMGVSLPKQQQGQQPSPTHEETLDNDEAEGPSVSDGPGAATPPSPATPAQTM